MRCLAPVLLIRNRLCEGGDSFGTSRERDQQLKDIVVVGGQRSSEREERKMRRVDVLEFVRHRKKRGFAKVTKLRTARKHGDVTVFVQQYVTNSTSRIRYLEPRAF
jgi:hypothetical protein